MPRQPRSVDDAISRFDEAVARYDGRSAAAVGAARREYGRNVQAVGRKLATMGMAIGALIVATIAFGLIVGPIGWTGLFVVVVLMLVVLGFLAARPNEPKQAAYSDALPTKAVVQQLDSYLVRRRSGLPAAAARKVDAISALLPMLEAKLAGVDALDPAAQDARRLMGRHLPDLIERYQRVPAAYRGERDAEGLSVDERLVAGLEAARAALDEIGAKLAQQDLDAFDTQGRFIESRYKDGGVAGK